MSPVSARQRHSMALYKEKHGRQKKREGSDAKQNKLSSDKVRVVSRWGPNPTQSFGLQYWEVLL